jgi:IS30 family transposase
MDNKLRGILEILPESLPRSCLDPVREFIDELRRRGRTYREVVRILAQHCEIRVSVSTVYRFLHSPTRTKPRPRSRCSAKLPQMTKQSPVKLTAAAAERVAPAFDEIQQRIAALKHRPTPTIATPKLFSYDPDEPLHIPQKTQAAKGRE